MSTRGGRGHRREARGPGVADERGTATVAVLALIGVVLLVASAAAAVLAAVVAHRQAQAAADLAALSGAAAAQRGVDACAAADEVAGANGAALAACRIDGDDVLVTVAVRVPVAVVRDEVQARARAGPS